MGVMIYRRVVNVYDIPLDILVETLGRGLTINREAADFPLLEPDIGKGLRFDGDGKIEIDPTVDHYQSTEYIVQVDSKLSLDAQKLTLTKTYQKHNVLRNAAGVTVSVSPGDTFEETEDVILAVPYGYGYSSADAKSLRASTSTAPNFYKQ